MKESDITQEFRLKCGSSFSYFCEHVLELEMTKYHKEISQLPLYNRYLCIVIPTGHSKTTLFSTAYALWKLYKERDFEMCLVSSSLEQSMKIFAGVQYILESNPFFKDLIPTDKRDSWNKSQIVTSNHNQYYVKPFNSTARGIHPNVIIYDDLLRETDIGMDQIKDIFWGIYYPRGQIHKCQHIVVGTPQTPDDLYADIEKRGKGKWKIVRRSAVKEDANGNWLEPLWPQKFSLESLKEIREGMGGFRFEREYMCNPRASGDSLFPPEMVLNCMDYNLEFNYDMSGRAYIGTDFAMSTKSSGDYNVFTVVDSVPGQKYVKQTDSGPVEIENPVFLRRMIRFRGNSGHLNNVKQLLEFFPNSKVIADHSGVGAKFVQEFRENQISVDAQAFNPANRNMLLLGLRRLIEQNRLVIPGGDESSPLVNRLLKELGSFRQTETRSNQVTFKSNLDHDDCVISLALAVKDVSTPRKVMTDCIFGV